MTAICSTVFATDASGSVVYSALVHVAQNSTSLDRMLKAAMPEADVRVTQVGQGNEASAAPFRAMGGRPLHDVCFYRKELV